MRCAMSEPVSQSLAGEMLDCLTGLMQLCGGGGGRGDWTSPERDEADQAIRREALAGEKYNDSVVRTRTPVKI